MISQTDNDKRDHWVTKGKKAGLNICESCGTHSHSYRNIVEDCLIGHVEHYLFNTTNRITILSIGAGELLQEYLLLKKLVSRGFKEIEMTVVDPVFRKKEKLEIFRRLINRIDNQKCKIFIQDYVNMQNCFEANPAKKYDMICAIDFENLPQQWNMILEARSRLKTEGTFFSTCKKSRLIMSEGIFHLQKNSGEEKAWINHFVNENSSLKTTGEKIRFGINAPGMFAEMYFSCLGALIGKGLRNFTLDLKRDSKIAYDKDKVQRLCTSFVKFFPETIVDIQEIDQFEDTTYHLLALTSYNVIDETFITGERIIDKMKHNGVMFFDFSNAVSDNALTQMGLSPRQSMLRMKEKARREKQITEIKKKLPPLGLEKNLFIHKGQPLNQNHPLL